VALSLGACMKQSTMPGGLPGSPSSGMPSGSPSSPTAGTHTPGGSGSTPGKDTASLPTPGTEGGTAAGSGKSAGKPEGKSGSESRSDDEILADALEEFEKRNQDGTGNNPEGDPAAKEAAAQAAADKAAAEAAKQQAADARMAGPATDAEKARDLDRELQDEFAKFDKVMQREREAVAMQDNEEGNRGFSDRDSYDVGDGEGSDGDGTDEKANSESAAAEGIESEHKVPPGQQGTGRLGDKDIQVASTSTVPDDIESGADDDIIARQLREAAMKEPDPELREKLWDEYRKYKRGK
jgi:hypothetical protein